MELGTARITPPRSSMIENPTGLDGGVKIGSGKPVTPFWRMHSDI
jgi:hypothetical protein